MDWLKQWGLAIIGMVIAAVAIFGGGFLAGQQSEAKEGVEELRKRDAAHAEELAKANRLYRAAEAGHAADVADLRAEWNLKEGKANAKHEATLSDLRSGNKRLRLQVARCESAATSAAQAGTPTAGTDGGAVAELDRTTGTALYSIVGEGDAAIREHNGLIEWARRAVKLCGGSP